jgi:hypothetical protein
VLHDVFSFVLSNTWRETARGDTRFLIGKSISSLLGLIRQGMMRSHIT